MTVWVLHCWARDLPWGEICSQHVTLEDAIYAALAWVEAERMLLPQQRAVYSIAQSDEYIDRWPPSLIPHSGRTYSTPTTADC